MTLLNWSTLAFALLLSTPVLSAEPEPCDVKNANIQSIISWAEETSHIKDIFLQTPQTDDYQTDVGGIIDPSCFEGKSEKEKKKLRERLNSAFTYTAKQATQCFQTLGFPEMKEIIPLLRRVIVHCDNANRLIYFPGVGKVEHTFTTPRMTAAAAIIFPISQSLLFWEKSTNFNAAKIHQFHVGINTQEKDGGILQRGNTVDIANILAHELLHFRKTLNTSWHEEANKRKLGGCSNSLNQSLFEDRIYMIASACFPSIASGYSTNSKTEVPIRHAFWNNEVGAVHCPDVCHAALTKVKPGSKILVEGEYVADPYSAMQAEASCSKLQSLAKGWKEISSEREKIKTDIIEFLEATRLPFSKEKERVAWLEARALEINSLLDQSLSNPTRSSDFRQGLKKIEHEVQTHIENTCASLESPEHCKPESFLTDFLIKTDAALGRTLPSGIVLFDTPR